MDVNVEEPRPQKGANPRQSTRHEVERILRRAAAAQEPPLSFAEIARRKRARKVRPETIRAAVYDLARFKLVAVGSKGVQWVVVPREVWDHAREPLA